MSTTVVTRHSSPRADYTVQELARATGLHAQSVRNWIRDGKVKGTTITSYKSGYRIPAAEAERIIKEHSGKTVPYETDPSLRGQIEELDFRIRRMRESEDFHDDDLHPAGMVLDLLEQLLGITQKLVERLTEL